MKYLALMLLGFTIGALFAYDARRKQANNRFSFTVWLRENWLDLAINVLCAVAVLLLRSELHGLLTAWGITITQGQGGDSLVAFCGGLFGQTAVRALKKAGEKRMPAMKKLSASGNE